MPTNIIKMLNVIRISYENELYSTMTMTMVNIIFADIYLNNFHAI